MTMIHTGEVEWEAAHRALVALAAARAAHEHALGAALLRAERAEVWRALGMASFFEYAERVVASRRVRPKSGSASPGRSSAYLRRRRRLPAGGSTSPPSVSSAACSRPR